MTTGRSLHRESPCRIGSGPSITEHAKMTALRGMHSSTTTTCCCVQQRRQLPIGTTMMASARTGLFLSTAAKNRPSTNCSGLAFRVVSTCPALLRRPGSPRRVFRVGFRSLPVTSVTVKASRSLRLWNVNLVAIRFRPATTEHDAEAPRRHMKGWTL